MSIITKVLIVAKTVANHPVTKKIAIALLTIVIEELANKGKN